MHKRVSARAGVDGGLCGRVCVCLFCLCVCVCVCVCGSVGFGGYPFLLDLKENPQESWIEGGFPTKKLDGGFTCCSGR